jgi:hypothetical protein
VGKAACVCDVDYPPRLAQRLKKEYSCTSTHFLGLRGLLYGEFKIKLNILRPDATGGSSFQLCKLSILCLRSARVGKIKIYS